MVPVTVSVELDTFPAGQRTMYFPGEHASEMDFQTLKGRGPREEPRTWGEDRVPAAVPRQGEQGQEGKTHAQERVPSWGFRPVLHVRGSETCFG